LTLSQIGASTTLGNFPVLAEEPERTIGIAANAVMTPMLSTRYAFGFWYATDHTLAACGSVSCNQLTCMRHTRTGYDVFSVRTVRAAAMINVAGNRVRQSWESYVSAANDFATTQPSNRNLLLGMQPVESPLTLSCL
jgi:hypothetical protein